MTVSVPAAHDYKDNANRVTGKWKAEPAIRPWALESRVKHAPDDDRALLFDFMGRMLQWLPEQGSTARELLKHEWLGGSSPFQEDDD